MPLFTLEETMKKEINVLYVSHEGVGDTIFNSQVLEHVEYIQNNGIKFTVIAFETFNRNYERSLNNFLMYGRIYKNINMKLHKDVNQYLPFSSLFSAFNLVLIIKKLGVKFDVVHARADYSAFVCLIAKFFLRIPVIWDCRGDSVDEFKEAVARSERKIIRIFSFIQIFRLKFGLWFLRRYSNNQLFVSKELAKLFYTQIEMKERSIKVIPTLIPEGQYFFDSDIRAYQRKKLGFSEDHVVFIYSGSMNGYQSIEDNIKWFRSLKLEKCFLVLATKDILRAQEIVGNDFDGNIKIVSVDYNCMNNLYNAADVALLIRESRRLNWVASPTKFGEYASTGLHVVMNDSIQQSCSYAKKFNIYVDKSLGIDPKLVKDLLSRKNRATLAGNIFYRNVYKNDFLDIYQMYN